LSTFHILPGKTSASAAFKTDFHLAVGEASFSLAMICKDGWVRKENEADVKGGKITRGAVALNGDEKLEDVVARHVRAMEGWMT
jgi:hypothetical protein